MKTFALLTLLALLCGSAPAQNCDDIHRKIRDAWERDNIGEALRQVRALRACDVSETGKQAADTWTDRIFKKIEAQKRSATDNLNKAERLTRYFNFGKEKTAWAYRDGLFAVIDLDGDTLSDFIYENPEPFRKGIAVARLNNQYVFVNRQGDPASEPYEYLIPTVGGWYKGGKAGQESVLNAQGKVFIDTLSGFRMGAARAKIDGEYVEFDTLGRIIPLESSEKSGIRIDGWVWIYDGAGKYGLMDTLGETVLLEPQFEGIRSILDSFVFVLLHNKWGVVNRKGQMVLQPQFEEIGSFSEGLAAVKKEGKWGYLDTLMQWMISPMFADASSFSESLAAVQMVDKWGYIDTSGQLVIPPQFEHAGAFSEGLAKVKKDDKSGYINHEGNFTIKAQFEEVTSFTNGVASFSHNYKWGIIDSNGQIILTPQLDYPVFFENGRAEAQQNGKKGILDIRGNWLFPAQADEIEPFDEELLLVKVDDIYKLIKTSACQPMVLSKISGRNLLAGQLYFAYQNGNWGLMRQNGELVINPQFDSWSMSNDNLGLVLKSKKWGIISKAGALILEAEYDDLIDNTNGRVWFNKSAKWGLTDTTGRILSPLQYDSVYAFEGALATIAVAGKWGMIDTSGQIVVPPQFDEITACWDGEMRARMGKLCGFINGKGSFIVPPVYEEVYCFNNGRAAVRSGDKWGFVDTTGKVVVSIVYEDVGDFFDGLAPYKSGGLWGYIDRDGRVVISPRFDEVTLFFNKQALVKLVDKWGIIDSSGAYAVSPRYDSLGGYEDYGLRWGRREGRWALLGQDARELTPPQFDAVSNFTENGWAKICINGKWGIVDTLGKLVLDAAYNEVDDYYSGIAIVQKDGANVLITPDGRTYAEWGDIQQKNIWVNDGKYWGVLDHTGRVVLPFEYDTYFYGTAFPFWVRKNVKWGLIREDGTILAPFTYDDVDEALDEAFKEVSISNRQGLIDTFGREVLPCRYQLHECGPRMYLMEQSGRYGLFAPDYGIRIEPAYEEIGFTGEEFGWIRARKNGKWGWVDKTGQVKIPFRFDATAPFYNGKARVLQLPSSQSFLINAKGEMLWE